MLRLLPGPDWVFDCPRTFERIMIIESYTAEIAPVADGIARNRLFLGAPLR